jgi:hypothetical protein
MSRHIVMQIALQDIGQLADIRATPIEFDRVAPA